MDLLPKPFDDLAFTHADLDRLGEHRDDAAYVARLKADPAARYVLFSGDAVLMRREEGASPYVPAQDAGRFVDLTEPVLLGRDERGPLFAATLAMPEPALDDDDGWQRADLRGLAMEGGVAPGLLGVLATAASMTHWHRRNRFCGTCGGPTTSAVAGWRRDCTSCGALYFPRTDPVVIMLVVRGEDCLLARQPRFLPGMYSCLAGFVEPGETIEDAVRREVKEEAGIEVGTVRYLSCQPWPFPASLMIGCVADALTETITLDTNELEDGRWFGPSEIDLMLAGTHPDGMTAARPAAIARHLLIAHRRGETSAPARPTS